jgi:hypothetical protein
MNKNDSTVAIFPDYVASWVVTIPSNAETAADGSREAWRITEDLFYCFGDFLIPTEVNYGIKRTEGHCLVEGV